MFNYLQVKQESKNYWSRILWYRLINFQRAKGGRQAAGVGRVSRWARRRQKAAGGRRARVERHALINGLIITEISHVEWREMKLFVFLQFRSYRVGRLALLPWYVQGPRQIHIIYMGFWIESAKSRLLYKHCTMKNVGQ